MSPEEAITHWQRSLLLYDPGPSEMVPSEAPEEGEHEQLPEHVTIASLAPLVYFPAAQSLQLEAPDAEYFPLTQCLQTEELVAPVLLEYVPAAQSLQLVDPGATDATDHVASKPL